MFWSLRRVVGLRFAVVIVTGLVVILASKPRNAIEAADTGASRNPSAPGDITGSTTTGRTGAGALVVHVVARNDTLWSIARRYGLSVVDIAKFNGIDRNAMVRSGDVLVIPPG
ncbi:MAG TPA: LysM domain-containing protein [Xanthobacteraceae bacterium]|nr:LysM domain-containing protein [Xanthobacteraceae bacterium]